VLPLPNIRAPSNWVLTCELAMPPSLFSARAGKRSNRGNTPVLMHTDPVTGAVNAVGYWSAQHWISPLNSVSGRPNQTRPRFMRSGVWFAESTSAFAFYWTDFLPQPTSPDEVLDLIPSLVRDRLYHSTSCTSPLRNFFLSIPCS
jgi:hypothetical protein